MINKKLKKTANRFYPIAINGFRSVLSPLISIAFSYIIVTYFSKELWGNFVEYMLFFFLASLSISWGSKNYLLRVFSKNPRNIVTDWQQLFLARLVLCLVFIVSIFDLLLDGMHHIFLQSFQPALCSQSSDFESFLASNKFDFLLLSSLYSINDIAFRVIKVFRSHVHRISDALGGGLLPLIGIIFLRPS